MIPKRLEVKISTVMTCLGGAGLEETYAAASENWKNLQFQAAVR